MNQIEIENKLVSVGDIFVDEWGYEQTNVDFYKVVGFTASGKSAKIVKVGQKIVSDNWQENMSEHVVPDPDNVTGKVITKRIGTYSDHITIGNAWDYDGKPAFQSHWH